MNLMGAAEDAGVFFAICGEINQIHFFIQSQTLPLLWSFFPMLNQITTLNQNNLDQYKLAQIVHSCKAFNVKSFLVNTLSNTLDCIITVI